MSKNGTSDPDKFFDVLMKKSVSKIREEAILEWEVVIYPENYKKVFIHKKKKDRYDNDNIEIYISEVGYFFQNPCHSSKEKKDECKCIRGKTREISKKTGKPKIDEHCRWPNYRNLNLEQNTGTNYSCACGEPIIYVHQIKNKINGNLIPEDESVDSGVGSNCIKKFLDCEEQIETAKQLMWFDIQPNKFCPICKKKNNRKNLEKNEFKSCKYCPPLCEIMDCKNPKDSDSQLCRNHSGNFNLADTFTLMSIDELPPPPDNILTYTKRSKAKVLKVPNVEY